MNKEEITSFLKKYPMSILLAIIALNLFSISSSLRTSAELDRNKTTCVKMYTGVISSEQAAKKLGIPLKKFEIQSCNYFVGGI